MYGLGHCEQRRVACELCPCATPTPADDASHAACRRPRRASAGSDPARDDHRHGPHGLGLGEAGEQNAPRESGQAGLRLRSPSPRSSGVPTGPSHSFIRAGAPNYDQPTTTHVPSGRRPTPRTRRYVLILVSVAVLFAICPIVPRLSARIGLEGSERGGGPTVTTTKPHAGPGSDKLVLPVRVGVRTRHDLRTH